MQQQSVASLQYAVFAVTSQLGDPSAYPVYAAFTTSAATPPQSWTAAAWIGAAATPDTYLLELLVGPGSSLQLAKGQYAAWVRIEANPEIPVLRAGMYTIY